LGELKSSLIAFGLPDLQVQNLGAPSQQEDCRRRIEDAIRRFEPRLREVSVEILKSDPDARERTLRFRIDAIMDVAETAEAVIYDTFLDPVSGGVLFSGTAPKMA
jgi:type VI secretion system protein ImpF